MGKSSPSPPPPPDPVATAQAQAAANKESAIATGEINRVNQITPYGNLTYSQTGTSSNGNPLYTATQTLSPAQQQMLDLTDQAGVKYGQTANTQLNNISNLLSQPLDLSSIGPVPQANDQTRQAAYDAIVARSQPQMDRAQERLNTQLANQGIGLGSEAYSNAQDDYQHGVNDFLLGAQQQAGNAEAQQYGLESNAYNQAANSMIQGRQEPLNELAAMLTGSQVQSPNFINAPQSTVQPADVMGATYGSYNGQNNAYGQQLQAQTANRQGTTALLGTVAMAGAIAF